MTTAPAVDAPDGGDDEISILAVASAVLRRWRWVAALALIGGIAGASYAASKPQLFESTAILVPQAAEQSSLGAAASQLGIRIPASGGSSWGPSMYVELLKTRAMLEPIIHDTVVMPEMGGRRVPLAELLQISGESPERFTMNGVGAVRALVNPSEAKRFGAVQITVKSKWPSVSYALAQHLVRRVNEFNIETRRSQAAIERQFVEAQAKAAEQRLLEAEERQKTFLQRNRSVESPELRAESERIQRDVTRLSQLYLSWMQGLDDARTREVRNTPVISVLEEPRYPLDPAPRGILRKGIVAAIGAAMAGVFLAILIEGWLAARRSPNQDVRDFLAALHEATPKFLTRGTR